MPSVAVGTRLTRPCTVVVRPRPIRMLFADPAGVLAAGAVVARYGSPSMRFRSSSAHAIAISRGVRIGSIRRSKRRPIINSSF